jgi:hypothetical protein
VKPCAEKGLDLGVTTGFSIMTVIQLTRRSVSNTFWSKNPLLKWNERPPCPPDMGLNGFCLFPKIKSALGTKISGYWRHKKIVMTVLKAIPQK